MYVTSFLHLWLQKEPHIRSLLLPTPRPGRGLRWTLENGFSFPRGRLWKLSCQGAVIQSPHRRAAGRRLAYSGFPCCLPTLPTWGLGVGSPIPRESWDRGRRALAERGCHSWDPGRVHVFAEGPPEKADRVLNRRTRLHFGMSLPQSVEGFTFLRSVFSFVLKR